MTNISEREVHGQKSYPEGANRAKAADHDCHPLHSRDSWRSDHFVAASDLDAFHVVEGADGVGGRAKMSGRTRQLRPRHHDGM